MMHEAIFKICIIVCVAASAQSEARESRTVQTAQGPVRGYKNDGIYEFYGIPYATTPTGRDRFKEPLPGPVWMQPLEAVDRKIICPQGDFPSVDLTTYAMQEDCLVANVYVPETDDTNLPVLVYVHGGGFQVGFGYLHAQKTLVQSKKIIAVNFNHRLGAHGFLCLGTEGAPGNAGMKDQVALLRWVKKNIANFGGNPDDVTIAGGSAGSTAVDLLMLSKMTEGLYSKVIPESGAGIGPWTIQPDPVQIAKGFARKNNFTEVDDIYALEEFYTTVPYDMLFEDLSVESTDISLRFTPCIERNIGVETFLENTPVDILEQGQYKKSPVLYGFTNMEGFMYLASFETLKDKMNDKFSDHLPPDLLFKSEEEKTEIAQIVKEFYFGDDPVGEDNVESFVKYYSDIMFGYPHLRSTQLQIEAGSDSLYLYHYTFPSPALDGEGIPEVMKRVEGAPHCAQSLALYDSAIPAFAPTDSRPAYFKLQETLREMWLNFITSGKPVPNGSNLPTWPPVAANRSPYMSIGEEIRLKGLLLEKRARFWDNIYKRFYKPPVPPMQHPDRSASMQSEARESRIVQTAQGPVRGYKTAGIFEFYGIPYATAPTGRDRFKDPRPGPVWMHTLDAVDKKIVCPQGKFPFVDISTYTMQEDCLIANIYMPDTEESNLPVLVYVHGGSYQVGFGYMFAQKSLVKSQKVVAVNFNYRLGIHGFLCLGTEGAPGNAGMKDQVALLRWVKRNIASFGGNPDDVTIAGGSAGSSAVDLLMLSKATEGFYNKVIPESGSSLSPFSIQLDPVQIAKDYASIHNFKEDDIYALEEFYSTISYDVLLSDLSLTSNMSLMFTPCVERNVANVETFLEDTPANILKQGKYRKVPVLYGFTDMEGYMFLGAFDQLKDKMNERFSDFIPNDLKFESEEQKNEVAQKIREFYFGDQPIDENNVVNFVNYYTDTVFGYAHLRSTQLQVEAGSDSIYLYMYSYPSPVPEEDEVPEIIKMVRGAPHCAQSAAVHDFVFDLVIPDLSEEYKTLRETIREMWLNFIKTGKPVPEESDLPSWPPVGANRSPYMDFGVEIKLKGSLLKQRAKFWDDVYERFYKSPIAPKHQKARTEL